MTPIVLIESCYLNKDQSQLALLALSPRYVDDELEEEENYIRFP